MPEAASEGPSDQRPRDEHGRATTIRLLQVLAAAALLLPLLLFTFASWQSYHAAQALAEERLQRSLDVMQEHVLKVFQSMHLALDAIDNLLTDKSEAEIAADEPRLHREIRQIQASLPEVQSIWIFGPNGHPQVMTRESPALTDLDYARRIISSARATVRRAPSISAASIRPSRAASPISPSTRRATTPPAGSSA
jgi:two-component system, NtrC family, sensor kinase